MIVSLILIDFNFMSNKKCLIVPIKGMHCRSCEILIEDELKELKNVDSVEVSHKTGDAKIFYNGAEPSQSAIKQSILKSGYIIGPDDKQSFISTNVKDYQNLGLAFLILMAIYLILKGLGITDINLDPSASSLSWGFIVLVGLVAGFSTCMALVGGLVLGLSTKFAASHPESSASQKFKPHLFFGLGRIISYALLGGLLGVIGSALKMSSTASGVMIILVGLVMIAMGLQLINIFPRFSNFKITLPKGISRFFGISKKNDNYSNTGAAILGALTFFLPCGFTQAIQLYAISTGSFWSGALAMGLFALGTAPGLLSIGGITAIVKGNFKERFFKAAGLAVIFFGLFNLSNGYTLASLSFGGDISSDTQTISDPNVTMKDGVQIVNMAETNRGYSPNSFTIKKGVPVRWVIDAQAPYSCASALIVPKYKIRAFLKAGENIVEFTPTETGIIPFSCSMGMYTGSFKVVDDLSSAPVSRQIAKANTGGGTCGVAPASAGSCGASSSTSGGGCGCGAKIKVDNNDSAATTQKDTQVIKTTYTVKTDISPNSFIVEAGKPVSFEIFAKEDGAGCMGAIQISDLYENPEPLEAGKTITMNFTPQKKGNYNITCAMGMVRGVVKVQ